MSFPGAFYLKEPAGDGSLVGDAPVVAVGTGVALLAHTHHVVPAQRKIVQGADFILFLQVAAASHYIFSFLL